MKVRSGRVAALFLPVLFVSAGHAATLQWGGGIADLVDGSALLPASGNWSPGLLQNWSLDNGPGFDYTAWTNGDSASFGALDTFYEVSVTSPVTVGGLSTSIAAGSGQGLVTIQGGSATTSAFTLAAGSTVHTEAGTFLRILSNSTHALNITTSSLTKTGAGTLIFDTTTVGNTNTTGNLDIQDGTVRVVGDRAGLFANDTLSLTGANSTLEVGQLVAASGNFTGVKFTGITGVGGSKISSTGSGVSHVSYDNSSVDGVIEGPELTDGAPGSQLGFVKGGNKTLTLNTPNSYTGGTTVYNGRLIAGVGGAVPGVVNLTNAGIFEPSATGVQPSSITVQSGARLIAKASTDLSTVTLLPGGGLEYDNANDAPVYERGLPNWASGILTFGYAANTNTLYGVPENFNGVIALGAATGENLDFSTETGAALENARLGATGTVTYSGLLTPAGGKYRLGGNGTLILDQTLALTGPNDLDIGSAPVTGRVGNPASSTVTISGANDVSGALTVGKYTTLKLEGGSGSLAGVSSIFIENGTLSLTDSATTGGNASRLGDSAPITFSHGGNLNFLGTRGSTEDAGPLSFLAGESSVSASGTALGSTGSALLRFAGIGNRNPSATVTFANGTSNSLRFQNSPDLVNGLLGGWTITGGANFTDINPTNKQPRQITPLILTSDADFAAVTPQSNYSFDSGVTVSTAQDRTVNSLRVNYGTGGPFIVDLGPIPGAGVSNTLTIESGGLLLSSNLDGTLAGGSITAGAGGAYHLFVFNPSTTATAIKTLASPVVDNGSNSVTFVKAGPGQVTLTSANSHSGGTVINNGNLVISTSANVATLGTGPIIFDGLGSSLSLGNNVSPRTFSNAVAVNADSNFNVPSGLGINVTFSGPVSLAENSIWTINGNVTTLSGVISGEGSLRLSQGGTFTINGNEPNTFSGGLVQTSGTLTLSKPAGVQAVGGDIYIGDIDGIFGVETLSLGNSEQINDASILTLTGGLAGNQGMFRLNGNKTETIGGLRSGLGNGIVENGGGSGTVSSLVLVNEGYSYFGGNIRNNAAGDASRVLNLVKSGGGTQVLAGQNVYTGPTTVTAGELRIDGTLGNSALTVQENSGLSGDGLIGNNTLINGWHRPGGLAGKQTFWTSVEYGASSHLIIGLNGNDSASHGALETSGNIVVNNGAVLDVALNLQGSKTLIGDAFWNIGQTWVVASGQAITGSFTLGTVSADTEATSAAEFGVFSLQQSATEVRLVWTPGGTPSPLQSWRLAHFGSASNTGDAADSSDPDHDGISNLLEFALSTSPSESTAPAQTLIKVEDTLEYRYQRNKSATQVVGLEVQWSDDFQSWSSDGITETVLSDDGTTQDVVAHVPFGTSGRRFVHLKAVAP